MDAGTGPPALDDKLRFLRLPSAYGVDISSVQSLETHMSWLFFAGDSVYKLKKPVRHDFLDFSTLARREFYCREELRLNARLAPGVYLGLQVLQWHRGQLALRPADAPRREGETVDWLVHMRRLAARDMLDQRIRDGRVGPADIDALVQRLVHFYRQQPAAELDAHAYLAGFVREQARNRAVLLGPQGGLPGSAEALDRLDAALRDLAPRLHERVRASQVLDGHGDLRPEHVCLERPPVVIDCLEFNREMRLVDWVDEIAFLGIECERLGAAWVGPALRRAVGDALGDAVSDRLFDFYAALRACLRARLALAHLDEPSPRTPARWPALAAQYLCLAQQRVARLTATAR